MNISKNNLNNIILTLIVLLFIITIINKINIYMGKPLEVNTYKEGFTNRNNVREVITQIYDNFYSKIYNKLFYSDFRVGFEVKMIHDMFLTKYKEEIKILDLGCGTGSHIEGLRKLKYTVDGMEISENMRTISRNLNIGSVIKLGNFEERKNFKLREYSHVTAFFFTIYYARNIDNVFKNVNYTLKSGGMFFVHLINKKKFDPILEKATNLVPLYDPQKYTKERKTHTKLNFSGLVYESDWDFKNGIDVKFKEVFKFDSGDIKQNIHNLNMVSLKKIVKISNNNGFKLIKIIDLFPANHPNNYIYCFKKIYGS